MGNSSSDKQGCYLGWALLDGDGVFHHDEENAGQETSLKKH